MIDLLPAPRRNYTASPPAVYAGSPRKEQPAQDYPEHLIRRVPPGAMGAKADEDAPTGIRYGRAYQIAPAGGRRTVRQRLLETLSRSVRWWTATEIAAAMHYGAPQVLVHAGLSLGDAVAVYRTGKGHATYLWARQHEAELRARHGALPSDTPRQAVRHSDLDARLLHLLMSDARAWTTRELTNAVGHSYTSNVSKRLWLLPDVAFEPGSGSRPGRAWWLGHGIEP